MPSYSFDETTELTPAMWNYMVTRMKRNGGNMNKNEAAKSEAFKWTWMYVTPTRVETRTQTGDDPKMNGLSAVVQFFPRREQWRVNVVEYISNKEIGWVSTADAGREVAEKHMNECIAEVDSMNESHEEMEDGWFDDDDDDDDDDGNDAPLPHKPRGEMRVTFVFDDPEPEPNKLHAFLYGEPGSGKTHYVGDLPPGSYTGRIVSVDVATGKDESAEPQRVPTTDYASRERDLLDMMKSRPWFGSYASREPDLYQTIADSTGKTREEVKRDAYAFMYGGVAAWQDNSVREEAEDKKHKYDLTDTMRATLGNDAELVAHVRRDFDESYVMLAVDYDDIGALRIRVNGHEYEPVEDAGLDDDDDEQPTEIGRIAYMLVAEVQKHISETEQHNFSQIRTLARELDQVGVRLYNIEKHLSDAKGDGK